ncbi:MAG: hypothetical protein D6732_06650 [Methanobacteriota archaeon]|nr:MAG: hypothetical protein D6732_06650 [Euryarchaeota archaeon]
MLATGAIPYDGESGSTVPSLPSFTASSSVSSSISSLPAPGIAAVAALFYNQEIKTVPLCTNQNKINNLQFSGNMMLSLTEPSTFPAYGFTIFIKRWQFRSIAFEWQPQRNFPKQSIICGNSLSKFQF